HRSSLPGPNTVSRYTCRQSDEGLDGGFQCWRHREVQGVLSQEFPRSGGACCCSHAMRQDNGGFELKKIEESTPTKIVALLQERLSDRIVRLSVEVEASEPHPMTRLDLQGIPR